MVAHQTIGGGVAEASYSFVDPCRSVKTIATRPISTSSPGRNSCSGHSRRNAGIAITASPVSASFAQLRSSMTKNNGRSVLLLMTNSPLWPGSVARCRGLSLDFGDQAVVADVGVGFPARLDGAEAVWTRRQCQREALRECAAISA